MVRHHDGYCPLDPANAMLSQLKPEANPKFDKKFDKTDSKPPNSASLGLIPLSAQTSGLTECNSDTQVLVTGPMLEPLDGTIYLLDAWDTFVDDENAWALRKKKTLSRRL
jgi:hypothetical protein